MGFIPLRAPVKYVEFIDEEHVKHDEKHVKHDKKHVKHDEEHLVKHAALLVEPHDFLSDVDFHFKDFDAELHASEAFYAELHASETFDAELYAHVYAFVLEQ